ncbi:unnamed protein product, partial [Didymodactylos carnosus]
ILPYLVYKLSYDDHINKNEDNYNALLLFIRLFIKTIAFSHSANENLSRYYDYCDKNKTTKLDMVEAQIGLLTIFNLINDQLQYDHFRKMESNDLLPIFEHKYEINFEEFKLFLVDILTEYVRFEYFHNSDSDNKQNYITNNESLAKFLYAVQ